MRRLRARCDARGIARASLASAGDARRTRGASLAVGGDARRTRGASRETGAAWHGAGGTSRGGRDAWREAGGASRGLGGTSERTDSTSLRVRTVGLATRTDARRVRGSALGLRGASVVRLYRIAPIASDTPTKTSACERKSEESARSSTRVLASVPGCSRSSDCIPTNGERCTARFERPATRSERCPTRSERGVPWRGPLPDAWVVMRPSNRVMACAKVGVLHPFLAMRRSIPAMCRPLLPIHRPFVAMRRPFQAMLHAFAATRSEGEDALHEESVGHPALHGVLFPVLTTPRQSRGRAVPSRGRGSEFVGMRRPHLVMNRSLLGMRRASLAILHAFAATQCEGEDASHEESRGHHALH
jgi:hypothetical protein